MLENALEWLRGPSDAHNVVSGGSTRVFSIEPTDNTDSALLQFQAIARVAIENAGSSYSVLPHPSADRALDGFDVVYDAVVISVR